MKLKVKEFQACCKKILDAVDTAGGLLSETLELKSQGKTLYLNVTNGEYYVSVKMETSNVEEFVATVDAKLFLSLIARITTDELDLTVNSNTLVVKANGTFKLPMIYDGEELMELKEIKIAEDDTTATFDIDGETLLNILNYNTKEIDLYKNANGIKPAQKMYYIDENGCITFTVGACVNEFHLPQPISLLLNGKIVRLFKLFKKEEKVDFAIGHEIVGDVSRTKVRFSTDTVTITSVILSDENLIATVPVSAIRKIAYTQYKNCINIDKNKLLEVLNILLLFVNPTYGELKNCARFDFEKDYVTITGVDGENKGVVYYTNTSIEEPYSATLDIEDVKGTLEGCQEQYVTMAFGNKKAFVVTRANIKNVIAEVNA